MKLIHRAALLLGLVGGAAEAHDSWLEPKTFVAPAGARVPVTFYVGHHGEQHRVTLAPRPRWLLAMRAAGPAGSTDLLKLKAFNPARGISVARPGTYLISLDTGDFRQQAAPEEFERYLEQEGLSSARAAWERAPVRSRKVREAYRRHAKTLVQVGPGSSAVDESATRRLGQRLEIVPAANPYGLSVGERLGATIWFRDKPLADAQVTLSNLERPTDEPVATRSDPNGEVAFALPSAGRWMLNVVWSEPSRNPGTDFQTSFSSLTFALPSPR